MTFNI